ncbi:MAG: FAD-dependent oxidoreductase, partial [Verrucomicrobiota bacterium]
SCAWAGAGMLAPGCELETADISIARLGQQSLERWPGIVEALDEDVDLKTNGSLVVAHPGDQGELERLSRQITEPGWMEQVSGPRIQELEPQLGNRFSSALFFPHEGHINNRQLLSALAATLHRHRVTWHAGTEVQDVEPGRIKTAETSYSFDAVADTRGMGARPDLSNLRGVRGELIYIDAPEVELKRPVRFMHPRYPIYIVPRRHPRFLIGATSIESEDYSPISVRSALELLSAAYALHPGFAEARVVETVTQCRPAFPDNRPLMQVKDGLLRINGLYRHGFLVSPMLIEFAGAFLATGAIPEQAEPFMKACT